MHSLLLCLALQNGAAAAAVTPLTLGNSVYATPFGVASAYQVQTAATTVGATWTAGLSGCPRSVIASFYSEESPATLAATTVNLPEGFVAAAYSGSSSHYSNQLTAAGKASLIVGLFRLERCPPGLSLSTVA